MLLSRLQQSRQERQLIKEVKEERRLLKEMRKLKRAEVIKEYHESDSRSLVDNKAVAGITLSSLFFSLVVSFIDLGAGIGIGAATIGLIVIAIFLEALVQSIFECVSDFIHMNFTADRERRRAYKQTKKVVDYAIKNDRLTDDQITLMLENLVYNARHEQQSRNTTIDFNRLYASPSNQEVSAIESTDNEVIDIEPVLETKPSVKIQEQTGKFSLVFNDISISIVDNNGAEIETISYDDIIQAETQEEIEAMPYSTIYGYVVKENKTIYIDMEQEIAIIK